MLRILSLVISAALASCGGVETPNTCANSDECLPGYACDLVDTQICLRACETATVATDCLAGQTCDVPAGETVGVCRQG